MFAAIALSVAGLVVLALSADQFVKGAARLGTAMRLAPIVVGAVVVGFGTSAPEMLVSALAAAEGRLDIGVGNVVGSNAANLSLVLAAAAFVSPVPVTDSVIKRDALVSVTAVCLFAGAIQGDLLRWEGVGLLVCLVAWLAMVLRTGSSAAGDTAPAVEEQISAKIEAARTFVSLVLVAASAYVLVLGAERVADELGLSGGFVGYTLVAVGTSAPEMVTAVAAARQRQAELLVGNLLGSNVFNSLAVGGAIGVIGPGAVGDPPVQSYGAGIMALIALICWAAMGRGRCVSRLDGVLLLGAWILSVVLLTG